MLEHGGRLRRAAAQYAIPFEAWLDLSTGINPQGWPVPALPSEVWARLPEENDGLEQAARDYYGCEHLLPVAGSQAAIQALPRLRPPSKVGIIHPGYSEHAAAWQAAGHEVIPCPAEQLDDAVPAVDVLLLIHPNNPSGIRFQREQLLAWQQHLTKRGGWLVVDEAFMDTTPEQSLCDQSGTQGLILLRSLGKFFGLAGARVGFVCARPALLHPLQNLLGPWGVSAPSRWVATAALNDRTWQRTARQQLLVASERLHALLSQHGLRPTGGSALFQWVCTEKATDLHTGLARRGILTRLFTTPASLRFGLPDTEKDWARLDTTLCDLGRTAS